MTKCIGILTAGGDCPGLNAAIRGIGKAAQYSHDMSVIGFYDGFRGLMENRSMRLMASDLSNILTLGGTMLGTSRDKPHKMVVGKKELDMTDVMIETCQKQHIDVLVCIGGGGTQKNALRLMEKGLKVITLPKTIDNDVAMTDVTFGFDTALGVATDAIDRLHSTASSHHRVMVIEIMGHRTGWLTLGAGLAGGADVILIPEIPYDIEKVAEAICRRRRDGKHFSIVAAAEGAVSKEESKIIKDLVSRKDMAKNRKDKLAAETSLEEFNTRRVDSTLRIARQLEELTKLESRVTILGYLQRGGTPSAADRLLATRLGTACSDMIAAGKHGVMVAARGEGTVAVPLQEVVSKRKSVPFDHPWVKSARSLKITLGD
ncbi:MAG: 6-phosphofructokinase [Lentisphaerae bacterium GWF2_45_14]|nr:MAG: 6-phosphofructokinase [Lentisphaerae bacterium GWF2_45_14]